MSVAQAISGACALLLAAAFCGPVAPTAAGGIASAACVAAQAYRFGDAAGAWGLEARIGRACLAGPVPDWGAELRVLGIRAGIQHDAAGFAPRVAADGSLPYLARLLPRLRPGS